MANLLVKGFARMLFGEAIDEYKPMASVITALLVAAIGSLIIGAVVYYGIWHIAEWPKNWSKYWGGGYLRMQPWELKRVQANTPRYMTIYQNLFVILTILFIPINYIILTLAV